MFDFLDGFGEGLQSVAKSAGDLFGTVAQTVSSFDNIKANQQVRQLNLLQQQAQVDTQRFAIQTQADIARLNAQTQFKRAQNEAAVNDFGFAQTMANLQHQIGGLGGNNNLMMWIGLAGIGIAVMQYMKAR